MGKLKYINKFYGILCAGPSEGSDTCRKSTSDRSLISQEFRGVLNVIVPSYMPIGSRCALAECYIGLLRTHDAWRDMRDKYDPFNTYDFPVAPSTVSTDYDMAEVLEKIVSFDISTPEFPRERSFSAVDSLIQTLLVILGSADIND